MENSDDSQMETKVDGPSQLNLDQINTPARLKFLADVENATNGDQLVQANLDYMTHEKGQAAFAFNRAKKVLSHLGLLEGAKVQRGYGSMGKAKEEFYEAIRALPPHVLEHIKNAMVWDSRISKSMRSGQNIFPDRHGRDEFQLISENGSRKKKKRVRILEEPPDNLPLGSPSRASASLAPPPPPTLSLPLPPPPVDEMPMHPLEAEERVRNLKAARLADAVAHPSFQQLTADQQHVIKDLWVQSLVGSGSISHI